MPRILAFDTSTESCSVALLADGRIVVERQLSRSADFAGHSEHVLELVADVLEASAVSLAACDAIAFGAGPGAFTGLRVACAVAQGLALGAARPVVPIDCLMAIAWRAFSLSSASELTVAVAQDARMNEIYFGSYRCSADAVDVLDAPILCSAATAQARAASAQRICGSALSLHPQLQADGQNGELLSVPTASAIAMLAALRLAEGKSLPAREAAPIYIRDRVALTSAERALGARLGS